MRAIHTLVRYLGISDGNMQEGSFRCDANVSIRPRGQTRLGTRSEIKNLNSFRFVEKAILVEIERQIDVIEDGAKVVQETRLYDADRNETRAMRGKEEANDYRYFPDPDLLPVVIDEALIERLRGELPELPAARRARFVEQYGLSAYDADVLTANPESADYFESAVSASRSASPKTVSNWFQGELTAILKREAVDVADAKVDAATLASLVDRVVDGALSGRMGKQVLEALWNGEGAVDEIIEARGLRQISDTGAIEALVDRVIAAHPEQVAQFKGGKTRVIGFLVGQVMKASRGQADPRQVNEMLRSKLSV